MLKLKHTTLFTALITPFNEDGTIDLISLDQLIANQTQAHNGIVLFGSTGEGLALSTKEKTQVLKHVFKRKISTSVLVAVGGFQLEETLNWLKTCEEFPIDGYLIVTPIYARPGLYGQMQWFEKLLDASTRPSMLYNVPARSGCSLLPEVLEELRHHENLWALKEASGSIEQFQAYQKAAPNIDLYSGNDDFMPQLAKEGAKGLVSVMSNTWPIPTKQYVDLSFRRRMPQDQALISAIQAVNYKNPTSVKVLLHALKVIPSSCLRPPLSEKDGTDAPTLLKKHHDVLQWSIRHQDAMLSIN